jgi:anti-anti-sigma factor
MANDDFNVTKESKNDAVLMQVKGRIDEITAPDLQYELEDVLNAGAKAIILNMARVTYMCSIGEKAILAFHREAKDVKCSFTIERPSPIVRNVMGEETLKHMKA